MLSCWLDSPDGLKPNEFLVSWAGTTLFDQTNLPALGWTNLQFNVTASASFPPHRPFKIVYATLYYDVRPTFVVDIGEQFEGKLASILAYTSQFSDQQAGKDIFPAHDEIRARVDAMARFYGMLGGVTHGEPFLQKEVGLVDDLLSIPVKSI